MDHCKCAAKLGDFYLHNEPGGAFYPTSEEEAKDITLYELKIDEKIQVDASYITNDMDFIPRYAKRI